MEPIPDTQHRPIWCTCKACDSGITCNIQKTIQPGGKQTGMDTQQTSTTLSNMLSPPPENYGRFIELMRVISRKHIPRDAENSTSLVLLEEPQSLHEAYKKQYSSNPFDNTTIYARTRLVDRMTEEKKKRWEEVITSTDLTHNSRKSWQTILKNSPMTPPLQHIHVWSTPTKAHTTHQWLKHHNNNNNIYLYSALFTLCSNALL